MAGLSALMLGACETSPAVTPERPIIVPGPPVPAGAKSPTGEPYCRDVGGYEAYHKRTGRACFLGPDGFNDPVYWDPVFPL